MGGLLERLQGLDILVGYSVVAAFVFTEDALLLGFLVPGETAAIMGGVIASQTDASLPVMIAVVIVAAILGDTVGFALGRRLGPRILRVPFLATRLDGAQALLERHGGPAVFLGRFVAYVRTVMPPLAGLSEMPYRRFLAFNSVAAVVFGTANVLLGYFAGNSLPAIERALGGGTRALLVLAAVVALVWWLRRRRRARTAAGPTSADVAHPAGT
ncbi:DedA family protein [Rhodococcus kronopolitis]|uniref:DedA family protein n=1 Tax=Rhodococcus kronopolitis TaxID=1460226 RepID=A0ABV9FR09_9NOCA